jgi:hypothetical protein
MKKNSMKKSPRIKNLHNENLQKSIKKIFMEKLPHGQSFISTLKTISKINHLSLKDEQTTSQSKLIPDPESPIKD